MITVITPTYKRPKGIIERAVGSLRAQTYTKWNQIICSDGVAENAPREIAEAEENRHRVVYTNSSKSYNDYGPGVRAEILERVNTEYVCFLDDDNILMPTYLEKMIKAIEDNKVDLAICHCLHYGPLPASFGIAPKIVTGIPPRLYNIDTVQIVCKTEAIRDIGWQTESGYYADGVTYEMLADKYKHVEVPEVLALHL